MARKACCIVLVLILLLNMLPASQANAQAATGAVLSVFQDFIRSQGGPWPALDWAVFQDLQDGAAPRPVAAQKPFTATHSVKGESSEVLLQSDLVYYIPGRVCADTPDFSLYGGYALRVTLIEARAAADASRLFDARAAELPGAYANGKFQGAKAAFHGTQAYQVNYTLRQTLAGFDNIEVSGKAELMLWAQGKYLVELKGGYDGCETKGPIFAPLPDKLYELIAKYLVPASPQPTPTNTPVPTTRILKGRVTDGFNHGLPNLYVRLILGKNEEVTRTDANGNYSFANLPGTAVAGFDPEKEPFQIEILLRYLNTTPVKQRAYDPVFQLFSENNDDLKKLARLVTKPVMFDLKSAVTTYPIDFGDTKIVKESLPGAQRLSRAGLIYYDLSLALALGEKLGPSPSMLPLDIVLDRPPKASSAPAWWMEGLGDTGLKSHPTINYTKAGVDSNIIELAYITWHEFGHHWMNDTYGDRLWYPKNQVNHGGYCLNTSTNDSWHEGWAFFYAALVEKEILKNKEYWHVHDNATRGTDLEAKYKSWQSEEMAVAALLLDLIDRPADYASGKDDDPIALDLTTLWKIVSKGSSKQADSGGFLFDMVDLYDNLKAANVGQTDSDKNGRIDLDDLFIQHGFYELDDPRGDDSYLKGKAIAFTSHGSYKQGIDRQGKPVNCPEMKARRTSAPLPGSYVAVDLSGLDDHTRFQAELIYPAPDQSRNFSYEFMKEDILDGRMYLMLPPPDSGAVLRISTAGQPAFDVDSGTFWAKVPDASDQPLLSTTFPPPSKPSTWVLWFTLVGLLLSLVILIAGMRSSRQKRNPEAWVPDYIPRY